jgi:hypothetical protein
MKPGPIFTPQSHTERRAAGVSPPVFRMPARRTAFPDKKIGFWENRDLTESRVLANTMRRIAVCCVGERSCC